jgi:type II secretory pathway pseudopilin PulG
MSLPLARKPCGASLIELLVVLFIIGMMMSLLMPALHRARSRADETVCENNLRQVDFGLRHFIHAKDRFPAIECWTVDILPWIEQRPLADLIKSGNATANLLPRPPVMRCPFQEDFDSDTPGVGFCHFILTVDRAPGGAPILENGWNLGDRALLDESIPQLAWLTGPELQHDDQQRMFALETGPHPEGRFNTTQGYFPQ